MHKLPATIARETFEFWPGLAWFVWWQLVTSWSDQLPRGAARGAALFTASGVPGKRSSGPGTLLVRRDAPPCLFAPLRNHSLSTRVRGRLRPRRGGQGSRWKKSVIWVSDMGQNPFRFGFIDRCCCARYATRLPKPSVYPSFAAARSRVPASHSQPFSRAQRSTSAWPLKTAQ